MQGWGKEQAAKGTQLCPTLCNPMDCSMPGFPVHHRLPEFAQIYVHWVGGKTVALTRQTCVGKVMSLLFNMLSRLVIAFLQRSKRLLISLLQWPCAVILESKKIKSVTVSIVSPSICHEVMVIGNLMDRAALRAAVHGGRKKSYAWLSYRNNYQFLPHHIWIMENPWLSNQLPSAFSNYLPSGNTFRRVGDDQRGSFIYLRSSLPLLTI